jgi:uncharacterized protein YebE (UPF0316 family)
MLKILIIFIAGVIETFLFTWWNLSANKKQIYVSSILMLTYMMMYLMILDTAFKDINSKLMIVTYAIGCAIGNYLRVNHEKDKHNVKHQRLIWRRFLKWVNNNYEQKIKR